MHNDPQADQQQAEPELLSAEHPDLTREHFIPLNKSELIARLRRACTPREAESLAALVKVFDAVLHHAYHDRLAKLHEAYLPFDPDSDTRPLDNLPQIELEARLARLFCLFRELLQSANFVPLTTADIEEAMRAATEWGMSLHVDPSHFERLEVYARGDAISRRVRRRWHKFFRPEVVEVPIYRRLAVIFRLKKEENHAPADARGAAGNLPVLIKLFKNVPKMDVDMLLPGTRVRMTWMDRGKIMLPTISGLAVAAFKIAKGAVVFAFAGLYGLLAFAVFVLGTLGYGVKSFFGYLQTKDKYHLHLTRSLYYQNLDNNAGVLARLLHEAEEQDFRESLLAYVLLWKQAGEGGWTEQQLDIAAEAWLSRELKTPIDFEVHDALAKLLTWKLAELTPEGCYRAVAPEEGCRRLDAVWDGWFTPGKQRPRRTSKPT